MPSDKDVRIPRVPVIYPRGQHAISRNDIDPDALKIMYRLLRYNYKAFLVGGGVRDLLLEKTPKDFDISTDATPSQLRSLFRNCRIIGRRFKLAHIFFRGGKIIEVSTFRDISDPIDEEDSKSQDKPLIRIMRDNKYGTAETDALRRDLTINGLFYDLSTFSVIDYVGGMRDLKDRIIRVIGDPDKRFEEDPVRMIRVVRHAVRAGFSIEEGCKYSIVKNAHLITDCPAMRVYEELKKDLCSGFGLDILRSLAEFRLLDFLLPELAITSPSLIAGGTPLANSLSRADQRIRAGKPVSPTVILTLVSLFYITRANSENELLERLPTLSPAAELLKGCFSKLAVPKKEKLKIEDLILALKRLVEMPRAKKAAARTYPPDLVRDLQAVRECIGWDFDTPEIAAGSLVKPGIAGAAVSAGKPRRRRHRRRVR